MESTYHWSPKRGIQQLPHQPMGLITSPTRHASQSIAFLQRQPTCMFMDRPQWHPRLQSAPIGAPWRRNTNVRKPRQKKNVGREKQDRLLCWYIIGTLPILLELDERDQENKRVR